MRKKMKSQEKEWNGKIERKVGYVWGFKKHKEKLGTVNVVTDLSLTNQACNQLNLHD